MMTIDIATAIGELNAMVVRMTNMTPLMETVGDREAAKIRERIRTEKTDPMGGSWAPWRPSTQAARVKKGNAAQGLLWDSGALLNSLAVKAEESELTIGTPVSYAGFLQDGTERMDARPFMGWGDDDLTAVELLGIAYIEGVAA